MTRIGVHPRADGSGVAVDLATSAVAPKVLSRTTTGARVALVGARALLLAGDEVHLDVHVGDGCALELVEVAGTVAYDGRGGAPSRWSVRARLGEDARLRWHGEPFVVASGADVVRSLEVDLGAGARALLREVLVLGRTGEAGGALLNVSRVRQSGVPLLAEDLDLRDEALRRSPAVLGDHRCVDTVTLLGTRAEEPEALRGSSCAEVAAAGEGPDVFQLDGPGTQARVLSTDAHTTGLADVWRRWGRLTAAGTGS